MSTKFKTVTVNPDLQIIRTVEKGKYKVAAKHVEQISSLIRLLEDAGLVVYGDGIHSLLVHLNGVEIGYQLVQVGETHEI